MTTTKDEEIRRLARELAAFASEMWPGREYPAGGIARKLLRLLDAEPEAPSSVPCRCNECKATADGIPGEVHAPHGGAPYACYGRWCAIAEPEAPKCRGCDGHGEVGNMIDESEVCPFCLGSGVDVPEPEAPALDALGHYSPGDICAACDTPAPFDDGCEECDPTWHDRAEPEAPAECPPGFVDIEICVAAWETGYHAACAGFWPSSYAIREVSKEAHHHAEDGGTPIPWRLSWVTARVPLPEPPSEVRGTVTDGGEDG